MDDNLDGGTIEDRALDLKILGRDGHVNDHRVGQPFSALTLRNASSRSSDARDCPPVIRAVKVLTLLTPLAVAFDVGVDEQIA
jgi:hypothetical protein